MDCVSLTDFYTLLQQGPSSLNNIQVSKVIVIDHLGQTITMLMMFCSTWEVRIILSLCQSA